MKNKKFDYLLRRRRKIPILTRKQKKLLTAIAELETRRHKIYFEILANEKAWVKI